MPLLGLHMTVARQIAADLKSPIVDADRGAYYLGATTPDIRAMTRWDRERTHFFRLDDFGDQSGVHRLLAEHSELANASALDSPTASFIAGYISHLVLDEEYITQIYRQCFGTGGALSERARPDVKDRLLQLDLERQEREDTRAVTEIRQALTETSAEFAVDFLARDTLLEWRNWQVEHIVNAPRFEKMIVRHLAAAGIEGEDAVAVFMRDAPAELRETMEGVGEERIRDFLSSAKDKARLRMKEYLS